MRKFRHGLPKGLWIKGKEDCEDGAVCLGDLKMIVFKWQTKPDAKDKTHKTDG